MDTERIWHKGPPPHIGWWMTKRPETTLVAWRWWAGSGWSVFCNENESPKSAGDWVEWSSCSYTAREIEWTDFYPKNARVPRINPEAK